MIPEKQITFKAMKQYNFLNSESLESGILFE